MPLVVREDGTDAALAELRAYPAIVTLDARLADAANREGLPLPLP